MSVQVSDPASSPLTPLTPQTIGDAPFKAFVAATLAGLERLAGPCAVATDSAPPDIQFVRIPLVASGDRPLELPEAVQPGAGACLVTGPWLTVSVSAEPRRVGGTFYWNERQLLLDQAVLAGQSEATAAPRAALPRSAYERLADQFAQSEILARPGARLDEQSFPPDLLWLFRNSPRSTRGPFSGNADGQMHEIAQAAAATYSSLAIALVSQCYESQQVRFEYESITEVGRFIGVVE